MATHNDTGNIGENVAKDYLVSKGFVILEENWRFHHYEVDIIATIDDFIVFVEVKTRKNISFGQPEDFVDAAKQNRLLASANSYVRLKHITKEVRMDVISIIITNGETKVNHIPNAFYKCLKNRKR